MHYTADSRILGFSSAMFFLVVSWFIGIVGLLMGFVMFKVVLVKKNFKIIALPIVSFILALVPFIGPIVLLLYISM